VDPDIFQTSSKTVVCVCVCVCVLFASKVCSLHRYWTIDIAACESVNHLTAVEMLKTFHGIYTTTTTTGILVFSRSLTSITATHHKHLSSARFFAVSYPSHMLLCSEISGTLDF